MQKLCFAKRLMFSHLDLPRYLSPHHLLLPSHDAPYITPLFAHIAIFLLLLFVFFCFLYDLTHWTPFVRIYCASCYL